MQGSLPRLSVSLPERVLAPRTSGLGEGGCPIGCRAGLPLCLLLERGGTTVVTLASEENQVRILLPVYFSLWGAGSVHQLPPPQQEDGARALVFGAPMTAFFAVSTRLRTPYIQESLNLPWK